MARPLLKFCAVLLVGIAACTASAQPAPSMAEFDRLMEGLLEKHEIPGGSLAISRNGKLVYAKGFGFADVESKRRVDRIPYRYCQIRKPCRRAEKASYFSAADYPKDGRESEVTR